MNFSLIIEVFAKLIVYTEKTIVKVWKRGSAQPEIAIDNMKLEDKNMRRIKIEFPKLIKPKNPLSFQDIDNFYSICIKIIRILPAYIQSAIKSNNKENLKNAEKIFIRCHRFGKYDLSF